MPRPQFLLIALLAMAGCGKPPQPQPVRAAVIGGMVSTGLWQAVSARFEKATGIRVQLAITGERELCAEYLRTGKADLLTMHSGDITTDLVADGFGVNMKPWARNDLVIVGPAADPAGIRGMRDGAAALRKIAQAKAPYLDFQGIGSREMAHNLWKAAGIPNPQGPWVLKDESTDKWSALKYAQSRGAYVITGRIPVRDGKLAAPGMEILVEGDPAMRRPFIVMEANPKRFPEANSAGAHALEEFLVSPETQEFIEKYGVQEFGGMPPFHAVSY